MKSILFATCHIKYPEQINRYRQYIDYYQARLGKLGVKKIILIDDGSALQYLNKLGVPVIAVGDYLVKSLNFPTLDQDVYIFTFAEHLGRPCKDLIPGWWRSFSFAGLLAEAYALDKLIHIESDTYVLSDFLFDDLRSDNSRRVAFSNKEVETRIQVLPKNNFGELQEVFAKGNDFFFKNGLHDIDYLPNHFVFGRSHIDYLSGIRGDVSKADPLDLLIGDSYDYIANVHDFGKAHFDSIQNLISTIKPQKSNAVGFHSGDMGDVIYAIPTMRSLGITKLLLNPLNWYGTKMNLDYIKVLKPLIESQGIKCYIPEPDKIIKFDYDLDAQRYMNQNMCFDHLGQCQANALKAVVDLEEPWIYDIDRIEHVDVIIARSARYHNSFIDFKELLSAIPDKSTIAFVGLEDEFDEFKKMFPDKEIWFTWVENLLQLAELIAGCKLFIGNQSTPYAIAEGLKVSRLQETCEYVPNCLPSGSEFFSFMFKEDMEDAKDFIREVLNA